MNLDLSKAMREAEKDWKKRKLSDQKLIKEIKKGNNFFIGIPYGFNKNKPKKIIPNGASNISKNDFRNDDIERITINYHSYDRKYEYLFRKISQFDANKILALREKIKRLNKKLIKIEQDAYNKGTSLKFEEIKTGEVK